MLISMMPDFHALFNNPNRRTVKLYFSSSVDCGSVAVGNGMYHKLAVASKRCAMRRKSDSMAVQSAGYRGHA
jgi:hypothetical protein